MVQEEEKQTKLSFVAVVVEPPDSEWLSCYDLFLSNAATHFHIQKWGYYKQNNETYQPDDRFGKENQESKEGLEETPWEKRWQKRRNRMMMMKNDEKAKKKHSFWEKVKQDWILEGKDDEETEPIDWLVMRWVRKLEMRTEDC